MLRFSILFLLFLSTEIFASTSIELSAVSNSKTKQISAAFTHLSRGAENTVEIDGKGMKTKGRDYVWHISMDHQRRFGHFLVDDMARYDQDATTLKVGVGAGWWDVNAVVGIQSEFESEKNRRYFRSAIRSDHSNGILEVRTLLEYLKGNGKGRWDWTAKARLNMGLLFIGVRVENVRSVKYEALTLGISIP